MLKEIFKKLADLFHTKEETPVEELPKIDYPDEVLKRFKALTNSYNYYAGFSCYTVRESRTITVKTRFSNIGELFEAGNALIDCMKDSIANEETNRKRLKSIPKLIVQEHNRTLNNFMVTKDAAFFVYPSSENMAMICKMISTLIDLLNTMYQTSKEGKYAFYRPLVSAVIETSINLLTTLKESKTS